jgi:hypothetical protein
MARGFQSIFADAAGASAGQHRRREEVVVTRAVPFHVDDEGVFFSCARLTGGRE